MLQTGMENEDDLQLVRHSYVDGKSVLHMEIPAQVVDVFRKVWELKDDWDAMSPQQIQDMFLEEIRASERRAQEMKASERWPSGEPHLQSAAEGRQDGAGS